MHIKKLVALAAVLAAITGFAEAQTPPADAEPADDLFFETVNVNVVNVEVHVTDKNGDPVTGLTRDDFEILEDKRPVEITNFYATEDGRPKIPTPVAAPASVEEIAGVPRPDLPPIPEAQRLYLCVYVDNFNIRPFNRKRVFRDLRVFLDRELTSRDQVMLVSYDRSFKVRHPFTNDPSAIAGALFELETVPGFGDQKESDRRELLRGIDDAASAADVEYRVIQYAQEQYNDMTFTLRALREYVSTLGGLEGRKALLYVSDGLEMIQGEDLFTAINQKFGDMSVFSHMQEFNIQRDLTSLTQLANTNRVSFYTIDAAGLRVPTGVSAETRGIQTVQLSGTEAIYFSNLQSSIQFIAEQTGGRALIGTNRWDQGLAEIARDFDTYYSLGYQPAHFGDGRYYKITVQLKDGRKGVEIRHRDGYRDRPLVLRMGDKTTSTLLYGFESNPLSLKLRVGQGSPGDRGNFVVPITLLVPIGELSLVPREQVHQGRIKIFVSAMDEDGRASDLQQIPLEIRIPAAEIEVARGRDYVYTFSLLMRGGSHRLAVGVRDEIGATESFIAGAVEVGKG